MNDGQLKPLRILPLRFTLRSEGLNFPEFSGSVWRGGLGMVLAKHSPLAFEQLYRTSTESRLYALLPPMHKHIAAGEHFELRLTLFGQGTEYALAITQAIVQLGKEGLRPGGHYELLEAAVIEPQNETTYLSGKQGFLAIPRIHTLSEYHLPDFQPITSCRVHFTTPLHIKEGNDLLRAAPSYAQLLRRTFSRIDQLAHAAGEMTPIAKNFRAELYQQAEQVETKLSKIAPHSLRRRSARSGQQMQFGGIIGSVDYAGEIKTTLPWLKLASITQLGGKTAFGFGGMEIQN